MSDPTPGSAGNSDLSIRDIGTYTRLYMDLTFENDILRVYLGT
jgi:hypothetical protein